VLGGNCMHRLHSVTEIIHQVAILVAIVIRNLRMIARPPSFARALPSANVPCILEYSGITDSGSA
jgi:hypothetical protein